MNVFSLNVIGDKYVHILIKYHASIYFNNTYMSYTVLKRKRTEFFDNMKSLFFDKFDQLSPFHMAGHISVSEINIDK